MPQKKNWTSTDFGRWMKRNGLSVPEAAVALEFKSVKSIYNLLDGTTPIGGRIRLACIGWESQQKKRRG